MPADAHPRTAHPSLPSDPRDDTIMQRIGRAHLAPETMPLLDDRGRRPRGAHALDPSRDDQRPAAVLLSAHPDLPAVRSSVPRNRRAAGPGRPAFRASS